MEDFGHLKWGEYFPGDRVENRRDGLGIVIPPGSYSKKFSSGSYKFVRVRLDTGREDGFMVGVLRRIPLLLCPRCEEHPLDEPDYLCYDCRNGIVS